MSRPILGTMACIAACAALLTGTADAAPGRTHDTLSNAERRTLLDGGVVARPVEITKRGQRYIGGVSYQVVRASPDEVLAALQNVEHLPHALPKTKKARLVSAHGNAAKVELTHGNSLVEATYTVDLTRAEGRTDELRFWLDRSRPHDIDDVWGYFRVQPFGRGKTLVTVAVALDLGSGLVSMLFEDKVQRTILDTPRHIRDFVEPRALAFAD